MGRTIGANNWENYRGSYGDKQLGEQLEQLGGQLLG